MNSLDVSTDGQKILYSYCLWWRHCDSSDRFRHWVNGDSISDAIDRSREEISIALGTNAGFWELEDPRVLVSKQPLVHDATCEEDHRYAAPEALVTCAKILSLCLALFVFYCLIARTVGSE